MPRRPDPRRAASEGRRRRGNRAGPGREAEEPTPAPAVHPAVALWIQALDDFGRYAQALSRELARGSVTGSMPADTLARLAAVGQEYLRSLADLPTRLSVGSDQRGSRGSRSRRFGRIID